MDTALDNLSAPFPGSSLDWRELTGMDQVRSELASVMDSGRMHPVVLLEGQEGLGKRHMALWMAARFFCKSRGASFDPCGLCGSCRETLSGNHPDVMVLDLGAESIKTADIETLQSHFDMLSADGLRVGLIMNADRMTIEACNRILKTLEEPSTQVRAVLTSSRPLALPATIRGRCLRWRVKPPPGAEVIQWLSERLRGLGRPVPSDEDLRPRALRHGFSPGRIVREYLAVSDDARGFHDDVRALLTADRPMDVLRAASNLARVHKAKVPEILNAVEWELSRFHRAELMTGNGRAQSSISLVCARRRRKLLREIRTRAVMGKITLNAQLVAESIGLCRWEEGAS